MELERRAIWREADRLFCEWLQLDAPQRDDWSAGLAADATVRTALERLIAAHHTSPEAPAGPCPVLLFSALAALDPDTAHPPEQGNRLAGRRIGDWELVEEIGRGGMSVVYRARRADADYGQQAAVKLLALGLVGSGGEARFAQERRVLASLDHPHIARLIDGGIAEDGTPFLVMHLVDGIAIDAWCAAHAPTLAARLRLMAQVCDAVAYAHRNLVVHRDLKPGNILVCGDGTPVLLDFGIARLLADDSGHTGTGLRAMTPGFAAPEQVRGGAITTATDVYGLGAVLTRLCADCAPLPRDVANIIAMAQREEPERRYPDARALAADLRRYLASLPVQASPDTLGYRLRVLLRRRRGAVLTAALCAVLLAGGAAAWLWEADKARAQAVRAEATRDFLVQLLEAGDIEASGGKDPRVSDLIAAGSARIAGAFADAPALRAEMSMLLGNIQTMHGEYDSAAALLHGALALAEADPGDGHVLSRTLLHLGTLSNRRAEPAQAVAYFERALEERNRHVGTDQAFHADAMLGLAYAMDNTGRGEEMRVRLERALAQRDAWREPAARADVLMALSMLVREPRRKLELMHEIQALQESLDALPVERMTLQSQMAAAYGNAGEVQTAVTHGRRALAIAGRIYPPVHRVRARLLSNLGTQLSSAGQFDQALLALADSERIYRELADGSSPSFAALLNNHGVLLWKTGHSDRAVPILLETVALARTLFGESDRRSLGALRNLIAARVELAPDPALAAEVAACLAAAEALDSDRERSACLLSAAQAAVLEGDAPLALQRLERSARLLGDADVSPGDRARRALTAGRALRLLRRAGEASQAYAEGLAAIADIAPPRHHLLRWQLHAGSGDLAAELGDIAAARRHFTGALALLEGAGLGTGAAAAGLRARLAPPP